MAVIRIKISVLKRAHSRASDGMEENCQQIDIMRFEGVESSIPTPARLLGCFG